MRIKSISFAHVLLSVMAISCFAMMLRYDPVQINTSLKEKGNGKGREKEKEISMWSKPDSKCFSDGNLTLSAKDRFQLPALFQEYVHYHSKARKELESDSSIIFRRNDRKVIVWQCKGHREDNSQQACGGVGCRTNGMRFALLVAILTNRTLFIDFPPSPVPILAAMEPALIDWTMPKSIQKLLPKYIRSEDWIPPMPFRAPSIWDRSADILVTGDLRNNLLVGLPNFITTTTMFYHGEFLWFLEKNKVPEIVGLEKSKIAPALTDMMFRPTETIRKRLPANNIGKDAYIAAHLRTGIDVREDEIDRFKDIRDAGVQRTVSNLLECMQSQVVRNGTKFFLASDSVAHIQEFSKQAKSANLSYEVSASAALHVEQIHATKGHEEELCEQFLNVFVDMYALAQSDVLIATRSGFSLAAAITGMPKTFIEFEVAANETSRIKCEKVQY